MKIFARICAAGVVLSTLGMASIELLPQNSPGGDMADAMFYGFVLVFSSVALLVTYGLSFIVKDIQVNKWHVLAPFLFVALVYSLHVLFTEPILISPQVSLESMSDYPRLVS